MDIFIHYKSRIAVAIPDYIIYQIIKPAKAHIKLVECKEMQIPTELLLCELQETH